MSNPSPPKPWERAGAAQNSSSIMSNLPSSTAPAASSNPASAPTSTSVPPALPDRPNALSSVVNQTASNYSTYNNGYGASTYGTSAYGSSPYGYSGYNNYSSFSSPYNRFSNMGSMYGGGYGSMYGGGVGGMGGMGGMYGRMGGPMDPNNPSLTQSLGQSTQATFQLIEGIVGTFGGFAQMLEGTYMATHQSFFAMVSVAEQFGNLRQQLGSILGIYTLMRWMRTFVSKVTGRPPPARAKDLTAAKFAKFSGTLPNGQPAPSPSRKPLAFFLLAVFGLPYLMGKLIKALAKSQEERQLAATGHNGDPSALPIDPSQLEFCRARYDFAPDTASPGVDLAVKQGDIVAVLSKADPLGNASEWWRCRTRDGRTGYLPAPYLETITKKLNAIGGIPSPAGSRLNTMTSSVAVPGQDNSSSRASTLTGKRVEEIVGQQPPVVEGGPGKITVGSFQKSMFNSH